MKKTRILILANTFYPILGGVETHLLDLIKEISKDKEIDAHLIAYTYFDDANNAYIHKYGNVKINLLKICPRNSSGLIGRMEMGSYFFYFFYNIVPLFIYAIYYCLANKRFDVIHANSHTTGIVAVFLRRIFRIKKVFISMHGVMFSKEQNFQKYNKFRVIIKNRFKKFDKIFCIGKRSYEEVSDLMGDRSKLEVFRYWVDNDFFSVSLDKEVARHKLGLGNKKIIFYAGRLVETKGILVLLDIARSLTQYDFVIAGSGLLAGRVTEMCKKSENILFLGKVENKFLPEYYVAADISILLTQGDGEGIPRALIESIACDTPVLATARGGTKELIDYGTGFIVDNDLEDIKRKIIVFLEEENVYKEKKDKCRKVAIKYFSADNSMIFIDNYKII